MGVRFACHVCDKPLNIKQELAGRRGVCPACGVRFRIPLADSRQSTPLLSEPTEASDAAAGPSETPPTASPSSTASTSSQTDAETSSAPASGSASLAAKVAAVDPLGDAAISTWYVRPPSGGQYGPATTPVLRQWINEGRVAATALVWREGWAQWREAREFLLEFAGDLPVAGLAAVAGASFPGDRGAAAGRKAAGDPSDSAVIETTVSTAAPSGMVGSPGIGKVRRERSLRRALAIGVLSIVSVTLILALVAVVRNSS